MQAKAVKYLYLAAFFVPWWRKEAVIGRDNPLKAIEDTVEQNDNSFDGIINNTPQKTEIKEKPERKAEAKRSIRGFLRESQGIKKTENKSDRKQKGMEIWRILMLKKWTCYAS